MLWRWLYPISLVVVGAFQLATIRPGVVYNEDGCLFLAHARNLAFAEPYNATNFIYTTETATYSPAEYPPVFPIMLAPVYRLSGLQLLPYKILIVATLMVSLVLIARFYRKKTTRPQLLLLLVLLGFCPFITELKNEILSDIPFLLFVYALFLLISIVGESETPNYWVSGISVGLVSYLAYGTRTIGIGLIPCIIIFGLIRHRRLPRFSIIAAVVFAALAYLQSRLVSSDSDYLRMAILDPRAPIRNLHFYVGTTSYLWDIGRGSLARLLIFAIATCLFLVGAWRVGRESLDIASLFFIGYGLFLIFWPLHQGHYLLPLLPVYMYFIVRGVYALQALIGKRWPPAGRVIAISLACTLLLAYVGKYRAWDFQFSREGWDSVPSMQFYDFVRNATPQNAVFVAGAPRALALYTGRRAARFPERFDKQTLLKYISKVGATYLVASPIDNSQWIILCQSISGAEPVFVNSSYAIFKTKVASYDVTQ